MSLKKSHPSTSAPADLQLDPLTQQLRPFQRNEALQALLTATLQGFQHLQPFHGTFRWRGIDY